MSRSLGGRPLYGNSREMTVGWKQYRYLRATPSLRPEIAAMEKRVNGLAVFHVPKSKVRDIESKLQNGDIIGISTHEPGGRTSHVGLAIRTADGVLHFMHASSPRNHGRVVIDDELYKYLYKFTHHAGIMVGRPLK
jgi:hypothetical protein